MTESAYDYSGTDNLEVMREAPRYNAYLCTLVRRNAPSHGTALDFGAGLGTFSACLAQTGISVECVEPDAAQRERLATTCCSTYRAIEEVADQSVDYVFSLNVLEHIEDDFAAAVELHRVLRPGSRLFLYLPAFQMLFSSMDRKVGHYRRYRRASIVRLLAAAGFQIERVHYTDVLGFFATLAYKCRDRDSSGDLDRSAVRFYDRWFFPFSRILSILFGPFLGKNLIVVATRSALGDSPETNPRLAD